MHWRLCLRPPRLRRLRLRLVESQASCTFTDERTVDQVRLVDVRDATDLGRHITIAFDRNIALSGLAAFVAEATARDVQDGSRTVHQYDVAEEDFDHSCTERPHVTRQEARHSKRGNERRTAELLQ